MAVTKPDSPRGQKRRQSVNLEKMSTSSSSSGGDKIEDVLKARSEKFGTPLVDTTKEIREPPRKMARSGLSGMNFTETDH